MAIDPKKAAAAKQAQQLMTALGSMSEMAHQVHQAMLQSGATKREAELAMNAWISAFWHESMEDARRGKERQNESEEAE